MTHFESFFFASLEDVTPRSAALIALLAIGSFAGPVQPINAELAVEVTYPCDENALEAVQQLCGNLATRRTQK